MSSEGLAVGSLWMRVVFCRVQSSTRDTSSGLGSRAFSALRQAMALSKQILS